MSRRPGHHGKHKTLQPKNRRARKNSMNRNLPGNHRSRSIFGIVFLITVMALLTGICEPMTLTAQENQPNIPESAPELVQTPNAETDDAREPVAIKQKGLNLLDLLRHGGWFMVPLGLLSILVVSLAIERTLALREEKVIPPLLVRELGNLSRQEEGFDPRQAFRSCQSHPSAASRVLRVMLLKAGRPQSEVEYAVAESAEREATKLQSTVSWLTLAAAVAPLIGLLGTVWGMIQAFYDTTQLVAGQNKAEILAQGIYTALVTTLCGLIIAIPAAVLAHFFDNRIVRWFHKIEELAASLTPMMEQFEGKVRISSAADDRNVTRKESRSNSDLEPADVVPPQGPR